MRLLVIVRQVPDSRATIKVSPDGKAIETSSVKFVCNPFDEFAVAQAVLLKEQRSDIQEIVVATLGPANATQALRTALAMGADRGLHLVDDRLAAGDEILQARALALAIRKQDTPFDLIITGKQAIDTDSGEFGPALAQYLDLPHIGAVVKLELAADGTSLRAHRRIEGADEIHETPLPALLTCEKGLIEPRLPSLPNLMKAKKKPLETLSVEYMFELEPSTPGLTLLELSPPVPRAECKLIEGTPEEMARELARVLHEEAKVI